MSRSLKNSNNTNYCQSIENTNEHEFLQQDQDVRNETILIEIDKLIRETNDIKSKLKTNNQEKLILQDRIDDLETALNENFTIINERENEFYLLEEQNAELIEKLQSKNQDPNNLSLQNDNSIRCLSCQHFKERIEILKEKVNTFLSNKKESLPNMHCKLQEAWEILITEMDTQIAGLEVSGARNQEQIEKLDHLRSHRNILNQRLKVESENSIVLQSDCKKLEEELCQLLTIKEPILDDHD